MSPRSVDTLTLAEQLFYLANPGLLVELPEDDRADYTQRTCSDTVDLLMQLAGTHRGAGDPSSRTANARYLLEQAGFLAYFPPPPSALKEDRGH